MTTDTVATTLTAPLTVERVSLARLKPHPRNYQQHPEEQLLHLEESLREHGWYRNVVVAKDKTILAGHGIVEAARRLGMTEAPVVVLPLKPTEPRALKVLAADNELSHLAEVDDRALSELLKEVSQFDLAGLLGTGYDEQMLANLVMVTRPKSEIEDIDEAAEWAGMPDYEAAETPYKLWVNFRTTDDRDEFCRLLGLPRFPVDRHKGSIWFPPRKDEDPMSLRFDPTETEGE